MPPKAISIALATILLAFGAVSMLTPIPGGTIAIALALMLLICTSPRFARAIGRLRQRLPLLNKAMTWLEDRAGQRMGTVLRTTRPPIA